MESNNSKKLPDAEKAIYLKAEIAVLHPYLINQGWIPSDVGIKRIEIPGEGNMNLVLRVIPSRGDSFILKQARPWVEKYPHLDAPVERILVESEYFKYINQHPEFACCSPAIKGFDNVNKVLIMDDLGHASDFNFVYKQHEHFSQTYIHKAINYLNNLKELPPPVDYPDNLELRRLNHQHIFYLPFRNNSFNLDQVQPGLAALAASLIQDKPLVRRIDDLGSNYLSTGSCLLHGDYYPGSLLKSNESLKVIDPEFSFLGPEEWDIAVFTAHLFLSGTPLDLIQDAISRFNRSKHFDMARFAGFTGTEILRRLLGLAQLPIDCSVKEKSHLVKQASHWIKTGKIDTLSGYEEHHTSH
ncbi:MAG: methylthioribose kinase [Cyclobacteriaceae bacterium]|nr:MAG: methylthioribose kinase [Cyclobacteriaceae bacterium]